MAASLLLAACNGTPQAPMVGADRDEHGCIGSAGYQWSELTGQCVRLFEQAVRCNLWRRARTGSAFVLFNDDRSQAELTLPSGERVRLIRQGKRVAGPGRAAPISSIPGRAMCSSPASGRCFTVTTHSESNSHSKRQTQKTRCRQRVFFGA